MKKATPNFYHKGTEYTRMDGEAWKDIWAQDKASWHRENVHGWVVWYMLNTFITFVVFHVL